MAAREIEGVAGKQADGTAKTSEAKVIVCREADRPGPKAGAPRADRESRAVSVRIDSARSADGAGRASEFTARLAQFTHRNGVLAAEEVAVLSDGAAWIRNVCEEILPGRKTTFILDLYHALEYASAAVKAAAPDEGKRKAWMGWIRKQLDAGRVDRVIAALKPYRRFEAVAACIRYFKANRDRMRYDLYRKRGLPVGSGFVESALEAPKAGAKDYSDNDPGNWGGVGMTEDEATLFYIIGAGDGSWGAFFNLSFLYAYRTFMHGFSDRLRLIQGLFDSQGNFSPGPDYGTEPIYDSLGNQIPNPGYLGVKCFDDCLFFQPVKIPGVEKEYSLYSASKANSDGLNVKLYFSTKVQGIRKNSNSPLISVSSTFGAVSYDSVILTVPTWQFYTEIDVENFDTTTEWPFDLQTYLKRAHWEPCAKIFVGLNKPFWEDPECKIPQCIATDTFLQDIYGVKVSRGGSEQTGTLLLSYTWWRDANKLVSYDDKDLVALAVKEADLICINSENVQQSIQQYIDAESGYVIHWERMPTYKGAARLYDESEWNDTQVPMMYNQQFSSASQIYFAGEAYGVDAGWTEPAFRGAIDAILHLCDNHGFSFNDPSFDFNTDYPKYDTKFNPSDG